MANLEHVCLNNQSHYSLDVTEFPSELCDTQSSFIDSIGMNEKSRKLNPTCCKKSVTSLISFPVAQLVEHGTSNAKIMGSIPRESKS